MEGSLGGQDCAKDSVVGGRYERGVEVPPNLVPCIPTASDVGGSRSAPLISYRGMNWA